MCAPRDQRKSNDNQREQAELNAMQCQRQADVSDYELNSFGKPRIYADHMPRAHPQNEWLWKDRSGANPTREIEENLSTANMCRRWPSACRLPSDALVE
jgi:hypothetical protein